MAAIEYQRVAFESLVRKYEAYVELFRFVNNGSLEGITTFDDFYWRMTYLSRYEDHDQDRQR